MTPAAPPPWRGLAIVLWVGVAACFAYLFGPILGGYFIADDFVPLVLFRMWQEQGELGARLLGKFTASLDAGENHFYRPLSYLSMGMNYLASGAEPAGWMAVNVVLHAASGVLAAALGVKLVPTAQRSRAWAAAAVGASMFLFAAPGAEVVAWISGRFDAMATFFTLAACVAFASSRRALDIAWWLALACAEAAVLSKESAAIMPFAILMIAFVVPPADAARSVASRARIALVRTAPWIALALLYLLSRYLMFGTATQVYATTDPLASAHWGRAFSNLPEWLRAELGPTRRYYGILGLTALQLVLALASREAARAALAMACVVAMTLLLLVPHVTELPIGLSGRLFYQSLAFYAVLVTIGLAQSRLRYLMWGASLGLWIFHGAAMHASMERWQGAYAEMRALVARLQAYDRALQPGDFALIVVPSVYDSIPFASSAQGGLMLPPLFAPVDAHRSLVQAEAELADLGGKIAGGVVRTLRERTVGDYL
ncbi:MAG TPA: hypothetical protein VLJ84_04970, partial [Usitatibacter sp.]|nr:hypothetical protein [Usitatibacter sp.]